jgi:hypothetical protein
MRLLIRQDHCPFHANQITPRVGLATFFLATFFDFSLLLSLTWPIFSIISASSMVWGFQILLAAH